MPKVSQLLDKQSYNYITPTTAKAVICNGDQQALLITFLFHEYKLFR